MAVCMKKSETAALAKSYVSIGFDHGYRTAVAVLEAIAGATVDEDNKDFLSKLAGLLKNYAQAEKKDFFALVRFEFEADGLIVMKKK